MFLILPLIAYAVFGWFLYRGFSKAVRLSDESPLPPVSVLLPFRNEARGLKATVTSVLDALGSGDELIVINDGSEDNSLEIAQSISDSRLVVLSSNQSGKKAALRQGIDRAKHEVILTVDADIRPQSHWPALMLQPFSNAHIQMVCGSVHVPFEKVGSRAMWEAIDVLSLVGSGRALTRQGWAVMCNGANLAFRKSAFIEVGGYLGNENRSSGDDVFLLQSMIEKYPNGVIPIPEKALGGVETTPQISWSALVRQRIRWAGKSGGYKDTKAIFTTYFIGFANVLVPAGIISAILLPSILKWVVIYWAGKAVIDSLLVASYNRGYDRNIPDSAIVLLSVIYPLYTSLIAILVPFVKVKWKGRYLDLPADRES